jgi:tyrosine-protein kinase Etk/Wzc
LLTEGPVEVRMDNGQEKSQSLYDYLFVIWKRRMPVIAVFLIATVSTVFYTFRMQPVYEAYTTVRLENVGVQGTLLSDLAALQRGNPIETEIEVIKSRSLAEKVVTALNLNFGIVSKSKDLPAEMTEVILSSEVPYTDYVVKIATDSGDYQVRKVSGAILGAGQVGKSFVSDGLSFKLASASFRPGDSLVFRVDSPVYAARGIQGATTVGPVKDANIIKISTRDNSPLIAARIANELANQFLKENLAYARGEARSAREFIEEQLGVAADNLRDAEQKLKEYKEKAKFVLLDENAKENIATLAKFESDREEANMRKREDEKRLSLLKSELAGKGSFADYKSVAASPTVTSNPVIAGLKDRLSSLEIKRAQLLEEYTPLHPDVVDLENEINKVKDELNKAIQQVMESGPSAADPVYQSIVSNMINAETEVRAMDGRMAALDGIIHTYNSKLENLPEKEITLARLTRTKEVGEKIYTMLLTKLEEARISEAMKVGNIRVVDRAIAPGSPILPNKKRTTFFGALGGLMIGIGLAFFLEYVDTSVKTGEEIERDLELSFLGGVPSVKDGASPKPRSGKEPLRRVLITRFEPRSPISEAYRTIRTNLQYVQPDKACRAMLFTSPLPEEGKSTTLANISIAFAQLGMKTLIVDSDLRRPVQHRIFGVERTPGLTGVLVDNVSLDDAICPTHHENLRILPSGPIPPNPSELLGSEKMNQVLAMLRDKFELILFDSPPILAVTDAAVLGGKLDGVVFVVRFEKTDRRAAQEAKKLLLNARARLLGVVLNDVRADRGVGGYSYHYYYRSYYHPYYEEGVEKGKRIRKKSEGDKTAAVSAGIGKSIKSFLAKARANDKGGDKPA